MPSFSDFNPDDPKVISTPLVVFKTSIFDLSTISFGAKIYLNISLPKHFFGQNCLTNSQNAFFGLLFQKLACGANNLAKTESSYQFDRAQKISFVDLKKYR